MVKNVGPRAMVVLILCSVLLTASAFAQSVARFDASSLVKLGDNLKYGSYIIYKIGEGIYQSPEQGPN